MYDDFDEEDAPRTFILKIKEFTTSLVSFFNLYARFRRRFPKKGSLDYIIKLACKLNVCGYNVDLKQNPKNELGQTKILLAPGKYTESVTLQRGVHLSGIPPIIPPLTRTFGRFGPFGIFPPKK